MNQTWLDRILAFFERYLPAFLLGYKVGQAGKSDLKKENVNLKLEVKAAQDAKAIEEHNRNLSNSQLVDEIIRESGFATEEPIDPDKK